MINFQRVIAYSWRGLLCAILSWGAYMSTLQASVPVVAVVVVAACGWLLYSGVYIFRTAHSGLQLLGNVAYFSIAALLGRFAIESLMQFFV